MASGVIVPELDNLRDYFDVELRNPKGDDLRDYFDARQDIFRGIILENGGTDNHDLMAVNNGTIVGVGNICFSSSGARIKYIGVHEVHRRKGIGSLLLSGLEQIVRDRGKTVVKLNANRSSEDFFKENGYEAFDYISNGSKMRKDLRAVKLPIEPAVDKVSKELYFGECYPGSKFDEWSVGLDYEDLFEKLKFEARKKRNVETF